MMKFSLNCYRDASRFFVNASVGLYQNLFLSFFFKKHDFFDSIFPFSDLLHLVLRFSVSSVKLVVIASDSFFPLK